jgi:hypothetical protein
MDIALTVYIPIRAVLFTIFGPSLSAAATDMKKG